MLFHFMILDGGECDLTDVRYELVRADSYDDAIRLYMSNDSMVKVKIIRLIANVLDLEDKNNESYAIATDLNQIFLLSTGFDIISAADGGLIDEIHDQEYKQYLEDNFDKIVKLIKTIPNKIYFSIDLIRDIITYDHITKSASRRY